MSIFNYYQAIIQGLVRFIQSGKNITFKQGALNLSKEKNAANVSRTTVLLRYRIRVFCATLV